MSVHKDTVLVPDDLLLELQEIRVHMTLPVCNVQAGDVFELACGMRICLLKQITMQEFKESCQAYPRWSRMADQHPDYLFWRVSID